MLIIGTAEQATTTSAATVTALAVPEPKCHGQFPCMEAWATRSGCTCWRRRHRTKPGTVQEFPGFPELPWDKELHRTLMKPMSLAYSLKHCRHMFRLYFRMIPHLLLHTRLQSRRIAYKEQCVLALKAWLLPVCLDIQPQMPRAQQ